MPTIIKKFQYSGTLNQVTIPAGTTSVDIYLWGGAGGAGGDRAACGASSDRSPSDLRSGCRCPCGVVAAASAGAAAGGCRARLGAPPRCAAGGGAAAAAERAPAGVACAQ